MRKIFMVAALLSSSLLFAQQDSVHSLDEVVVTATKYPVKQSTTGKVVTVITRQQIDKSTGKDFAQLLNEQTGMTVSGSVSNPGKDKSVFLRGATSSYTLFCLDGIPVNDPTGIGGTFDIRLIPLEQIERVEILKGSQSTLYGSNAIAGVINIITRKAESSELAGTGTLSYGSYDTFKGNANFNRRGKVVEYNLNYQYMTTNGITEAKDPTGNGNFDKDGFNRQSFQANLGFHVTNRIKISPFYRFSEFKGNYDSDAFTDGPQAYNASFVNTGLISTYKYNQGQVTLNYGYDHTQSDYNGSPYSGKFNHAEAYVNHKLSTFLDLLAGVNYQTYKLPTPDSTNTIFSPYASVVLHAAGFNVELGGRYNKHNRYGDNFTYSFNPSYLINDQVKLFANASTGFRAPSIGELFGPFGSNPNLKPEKSRTLEGGVQLQALNKKLSFLATYFDRDIKNIITYAFPAGYVNRDRQKDHGIETELSYAPTTQWNLKVSYTYIDGNITQKAGAKDTTFYNLIRRPKHTVNAFVGFQA
ncbi:MAG TPA: TonB-dependent receptor, partial [Flavisolibacter sp.]|nr:TonB-dependent receptor [Flavisolibacter sp.]